MLLVFFVHFRDIEAYREDLWKMIGYAARYGNQPLTVIYEMTSDELKQFNDGLYFWIEKENQSRE